ncbi:cation transport protein ChaC [Aspergillus nomiae NRRL 13137]|uniref:glutathione-specific gamma-glutamylcyclotransferase n=1 Tax=Aspergillus nomiae NRRL (strain ATCC 15546 / NRRL 13137 / CBS 260.88 / M93) TaxID=1509407 RepID=A0A0L1JDX2_ASPN3|nr:cation transport protein ChaC [Aspergillus nomiae NRRL 13137]KNG89954.1 cation transport protein ChaC [Aspergillus nomiae NRRL 13137]
MLLQMVEHGAVTSQTVIYGYLDMADVTKELDLEATTALCTDHRGTPENPGRVVTVIERGFWETLNDPLAQLESSSAGRVWGAAYHIPASHAEEVHDYLDEREIDGYTVHYTPFYPFLGSKAAESESKPMTCMVYIGQPTNPQFLRDPARREPEDVAEVISRGWGQSGKNTEYLYLLEKALEGLGLGSADGYVTDLVQRVKAIEEDDEAARDEEAAERDLQKSLSRSEEEAHRAFQNEERV